MTTARLQAIWEAYNDYVSHCLMFDDPAEEIAGFDEWAELHHGITKEAANEHMYAQC